MLEQGLASLPKTAHTTMGIMHTALDVTDVALRALRQQWQRPIAIYPNAGRYLMPHRQQDTVCSPQAFVNATQR